MPTEIAAVVWLIALAVALPGFFLLMLARFVLANDMHSRRGLARAASTFGWLLIALTAAFFLYIQLMLGTRNGPGGLGSQGNPFAVVIMLAYVFILAPAAWITLAIFAWISWRSRRRLPHSRK
jgi:hypothetical protein